MAPSASSSKPSTPSVSAATATIVDGSLTSMICTPSSDCDATIAYVLPLITKVATAYGFAS